MTAFVVQSKHLSADQLTEFHRGSGSDGVILLGNYDKHFGFHGCGGFLHRTRERVGNIESHHRLILADVIVGIISGVRLRRRKRLQSLLTCRLRVVMLRRCVHRILRSTP